MATLIEDLMSSSLGNLLTTDDAKHLVAKATQKKVRSGEHLFVAGDPGDALAVVISGALEVILGQPSTGATVVATVGPGQLVGELEVMTKSLRVATLAATADTEVLLLSGDTLQAMLNENHPAATKVMTYIAKTLARRLAAVNQRIIERAPKPPAPEPGAHAHAEPMEIDVSDLEPIGDDDLDVLDKLWG